MRVKQTLALLLSLVLMISFFAACESTKPISQEESTETDATSTLSTEETVEGTESQAGSAASDSSGTIRFSWWGGEERHTQTLAAIELFEGKYPEVTVQAEYQGYDGYHDKMFTQLAGGSAPDLFQYNPENMPEIIKENKLAALNSFVDSGQLNLTDVSDASLIDGTVNGTIYGVPMSTQTICVIYNNTLFETAGVVPPTNDWTWQDYDIMIRELAEKLPKGVYPSTDLRAGDITTLAMVHQQGGSFVNPEGKLNFAEAIAVPMETFQNYMVEGLVPPVEESIASTGDAIFMEGNAAIHATFNAMATSLQAGSVKQDEYNLVAIPDSNVGNQLGMYVKGEIAFCISEDSKNKNAAVALLDACINDAEIGKTLGLSRGIPPSEAIRNILKADMSPLEQSVFAVQEIADNSKDTPEPRLMKGWMEVLQAIVQETDEYRFGNRDLESTIQIMVERAEKEFERAQ